MITPQRLDYIWADFSCFSQEGIPAYATNRPSENAKQGQRALLKGWLNDGEYF